MPGGTGRSRRRCGTCSAKRVVEPVSTLLGGALDSVPAYASWGELRPPGQRAEDALALVEEGFRAVKIRIAPERADEGIGVVAAVREAVGEGLEIIVDLNQWWRMAGDIGPRLGPAGARRIDRAAARVRGPVGGGAVAR